MTDNYTISRHHDWPLPVAAFALVCSILGCAWFSIIATPANTNAAATAVKLSITPNHVDSTSQEDPGPVGMIVAANIGQSLTPFQPDTSTPVPTATPLDTRTPYPTFTHTPEPTVTPNEVHSISDNKEVTPIIRYEQIVVTVVVEILITPHATPTPQPTPDYRATQHAITTAASKRAGQWETIAIWTVAFTVSVMAGIVLVVIVRAMWEWFTSPKVQVNETRDEILSPEMSPVDGVTAAELEKIHSWMLLRKSRTFIEDKVYDYVGGTGDNSARQKVARAIDWIIAYNAPPLAVSENVIAFYERTP